jgi:twitching motility protein PilT
MSTPNEAQLFGALPAQPTIVTSALITAMLDSGPGISDLIFSPGRPPQVERHGELRPVDVPGCSVMKSTDTARVARDLIDGNEHALRTLHEQGACDLSFALPERTRFRVNVFRQRGSFAVVMRVIASRIPSLAELGLPASLENVVSLKNGIVLVTGQTGSGKSSTLAAILDRINETRAEHILTIEDPIEFLHPHKKGPFTSGSCTPIRRRCRRACAARCARRPRSSWSARCATAKPSTSR